MEIKRPRHCEWRGGLTRSDTVAASPMLESRMVVISAPPRSKCDCAHCDALFLDGVDGRGWPSTPRFI